MKPLLLALLALTAQDSQRAADFFKRIEFESATSDAAEERNAFEILNKREHWIAAFQRIEDKLAAFPDNLVVKVDFRLKGGEAGSAAGRAGEGNVRFNLEVLGQIQRKTAEIEAKSKEAQSRGGKLVYKVPPAKIERVLYHELTHVLQREYKAPDWFNEGMATYLADDPNNLYGFALSNRPVEEIDGPAAERRDVYARGHLFWKWLEMRSAVRKVVELTVLQRKPWKESLEEAAGYNWSSLVIAEKRWSEEELQKYKVK